MEKEKTSADRTIVLNRMYAGSYLSTNLGHEVINMFQADNGKHYLYLNAKGNYDKKNGDKITDMLLVRYVDEDTLEILAWASGLTPVPGVDRPYTQSDTGDELQKRIILGPKYTGNTETEIKNWEGETENGITYGGVNLIDIFAEDEQQNIYITYKADIFRVPEKQLFLKFENSESLFNNSSDIPADNTFYVRGYLLGKTTLHQYILNECAFKINTSQTKKYNNDNEEIKKIEERITKRRKNLGNGLSEWLLKQNFIDDKDRRVSTDDIINYKPRLVSYFDVVPKLRLDENCFSDSIKYFIERDKEIWEKVFQAVCKEICGEDNCQIGKILSVSREVDASIEKNKKGGRIDLLIKTKNAYIIIENKIKSDINRKADDKDGEDQLSRYSNYADKKLNDKKCYFFLLTPEYNKPDITSGNAFKNLSYKELYALLDKAYQDNKDALFSSFHDAMKRHTFSTENESLYEDMKALFFERIKKLSNNQ